MAKIPLNSYLETFSNAYLTATEVEALLTELDDAMTKNASELSIQERNTVIEMVNSAIEDAQAASGHVTADQVQAMIDDALANTTTQLTEEQIRAIVNESVSNAVSSMIAAPDYAKITYVPLTDLIPTGDFADGTKNVGSTWVVPDNCFIGCFGLYKVTPQAYLGQFYVTIMVNGQASSRVIGEYNLDAGVTRTINMQSEPAPVLKGDSIQVQLTYTSNTIAVNAFANAKVYYYPVRQSAASVAPNQLSMFALNTDVLAADTENADTIASHKTTDRFRWQDVYNDIRLSMIRSVKPYGLIPDDEHTIVVPATSDPLPVNDEYGGMIGVTFTNADDNTFTLISINGTQVYSSDGLSAGIPVTKYFTLEKNDEIQATNATTFSYTPWIYSSKDDPNYDTKQRLATVESKVLALNARFENKTLGTDKIDIEAESTSGGFTVPAGLGGQISGNGVLALLLSASYVSVNDTPVYDIRGLKVGLGPDAMQPVDVQPGDVITSGGMTDLFYTAYVAASN